MDGQEKERVIREIRAGVEPGGVDWIEQTFLLPFPPSVNTMFPTDKRTGRRFVSDDYKKWRTEAGWALKSQNPQRTEGHVHVDIIIVRPDRRKRDLDNLTKALMDLLVDHGVIEDDSKVTRTQSSWSSADLSGVSVCVTGKLKQKSNA